MTHEMSAEEFRRVATAGGPRVRGKGRPHPRDRGMNKLETDYSAHLEGLKLAGQVLRYDFEPERLRLADATFYVPDFRVVLPDGTIEFHEVKGHWEDDARVKVKVAAELHPYRFIGITRAGGNWKVEEF